MSRWSAPSDYDYSEEMGDPVGRQERSGKIDYSVFAIPKPEPRKRTKGRAERTERKTKTQVRAECVERDGYCRVAEMMRDLCSGKSEWAHLEDKRRSFTRGMAPTERHSSNWTMQMCQHHHHLYDRHIFDVAFIDPEKGANGPIEVKFR